MSSIPPIIFQNCNTCLDPSSITFIGKWDKFTSRIIISKNNRPGAINFLKNRIGLDNFACCGQSPFVKYYCKNLCYKFSNEDGIQIATQFYDGLFSFIQAYAARISLIRNCWAQQPYFYFRYLSPVPFTVRYMVGKGSWPTHTPALSNDVKPIKICLAEHCKPPKRRIYIYPSFRYTDEIEIWPKCN